MTRISSTISAAAVAALVACAPAVRSSPQTTPATRLRIIGLNDFHGALEARPEASGRLRGGAAAVAAAIRQAADECIAPACEALILDAGDEFQGTPASNFAYGRPVVEIFNRIGVAAAALGNHEFDWGQDTLRARMAQARYGFFGANVRNVDGSDVPWIRNDTVIARGALRIGVVGVATKETATSAKPTLVANLRFVDAARIVDSLAERLRARGATFVIVVAHAGTFCATSVGDNCEGEIVDLARKLTPGRVDAIVSGHTHSRVNTIVNGVTIVQARSRGLAIDVVDLPVATPRSVHAEIREIYTDSLAPDTAVARVVASAVATVAPIVNRPIATIRDAMDKDSAAIGNLIADAFRTRGGADFAILNAGAVRADLRAGPATFGEVFEVQPFGNILYRLTASGASMRRYFEKLVAERRTRGYLSGAVVGFDSTRAAGQRITSVCLPGGRELDSSATYSIVINDFMLAGGSRLGFDAPVVKQEALNLTDLDALTAYLAAARQPVAAPAERRLTPSPSAGCSGAR
ncbi:MAG TPA: 5'-nucleotidase C-terminal domain-containing protein [Gemmatimonadaceae bacterium]|nr:5'-nucleotidase C-terminal domain-containing protein [Gemmatimonadaceae bacterium]